MRIGIVDFMNLCHINIHSKNVLIDGQLLEDDLVVFSRFARKIIFKLVDIIQNYTPNYLIVATDYGSWRKELTINYKQNRIKVTNPKFNKKILYLYADRLFNELNKIMPFNFIRVFNAEGDDIIYTLVKYLQEKEIYIFSTDKDLLQATKFNDHIQQISLLYNKFLVSREPEYEVFKKIIRGDRSDGIPALKKRVRENIIRKWWVNKNLFKTFLKEQGLSHHFIMNKRLIDLDYIPLNISKQIIDEFEKNKKQKLTLEHYKNFVLFKNEYILEKVDDFWDNIERWYKEVYHDL